MRKLTFEIANAKGEKVQEVTLRYMKDVEQLIEECEKRNMKAYLTRIEKEEHIKSFKAQELFGNKEK